MCIRDRAWDRGQALAVHGLIYNLKDGLLKDLTTTFTGPENLPATFRTDSASGSH